MIDSHCHLTDPRLSSQLADVLARAAAAGVERMVTIGTHPADWIAAIELCRMHHQVRCAVGVHPNYSHEVDVSELARLGELQSNPSIVAVGETGLDYHHHFADRARQRMFFESQMKLADELARPVVIHCREAVNDALDLMKEFPEVPAVFHCFTGSVGESEQILERGYLIGFTGAVTFKNAEELREVARRMPLEQMLVETDAPYLSPEPMRRQKVNEPSLVIHTAAAIARARGVDVAEIDRATSANMRRFFQWD